LINILFIRKYFNIDPIDADNGLVRSSHSVDLWWKLSYCKCRHGRDDVDNGDVGDGDDHKASKGSIGRSKKTL
jgi:hypothetical protein